MKVGVVSTYSWLLKWDNYGSLLQIYALQTFLKRHGHDAFLIRTIGDRVKRKTTNRSLLRRLLSAITRPGAIARRLTRRPDRTGNRQLIAEFNAEHPRHFGDFMKRHIATTDREFTSSELVRDAPHADAYVAGSDQVWAVVSSSTFLQFGDKGAKRLAYAVSRPWSKNPEKWRDEAERAVQGFDAISVRELEGIEVCRQIGRDDAVHVVDPVLLLDRSDYEQLLEREGALHTFATPFVLAYLVNVEDLSEVPWREMREFAESEGGDLKVVPLQGPELLVPAEYLYVPRPAAWINAFVQCASVVTTSYHGVLFAILMQKPFLVVLQEGASALENGRFMSVLKRLELEDRIYRGGESSMARQMHAPIDWEAVGAELEAFKLESSRFLVEHLSG